MTTHTPFATAVIQHPPVFMNLDASIDEAIRHIDSAAKSGARLVVFPETWLPGYPVWLDYAPNAGLWDHPPAKAMFKTLFDNSPTIDGPEIARLSAAVKKAGVYVVMGLNEKERGTLYNSMLFLTPSQSEPLVHRKLIPTYTERLVWGRGDGSTLAAMQTDFGPVGGLVCWEHWMPLARAAMHGLQETIHIAQWPMVKEMHQIASRHYAFEGQCFVVAAGCVLSIQDMHDGLTSIKADPRAFQLLEGIKDPTETLLLRGGSAIIAPSGDYLAEPVYDKPAIITAELNPDLLVEGRLFLDTDGHYSRPDVFQLTVNDQTQNRISYQSAKKKPTEGNGE
ncbi:MAG: carbon-nitrogen hydrolase family protein [Calditrichia bacterium]